MKMRQNTRPESVCVVNNGEYFMPETLQTLIVASNDPDMTSLRVADQQTSRMVYEWPSRTYLQSREGAFHIRMVWSDEVAIIVPHGEKATE
jgi:hypothetical protein